MQRSHYEIGTDQRCREAGSQPDPEGRRRRRQHRDRGRRLDLDHGRKPPERYRAQPRRQVHAARARCRARQLPRRRGRRVPSLRSYENRLSVARNPARPRSPRARRGYLPNPGRSRRALLHQAGCSEAGAAGEARVMPPVRIELLNGRTVEQRQRIGDAVHRALVETIGVPERDRFQIITERSAADLVYDREYLGIRRTDGTVVIQITISNGRTAAQKRALFRHIADNLAAPDIRREDVWINLVEVAKENWSFGLGLASYAPEIVPAKKVSA